MVTIALVDGGGSSGPSRGSMETRRIIGVVLKTELEKGSEVEGTGDGVLRELTEAEYERLPFIRSSSGSLSDAFLGEIVPVHIPAHTMQASS